MGVQRFISELWRRESQAVVYGWITGGDAEDVQELGPEAEGKWYLSVSCHDLSIKYDRARFGERRPVLQSLVTWPNRDERITVSRTLGPQSFTGLHDGDFARLIHHGVALTGDLPMNSGAVDVTVGLLAAPGESLLDIATEFLNDLAELTQVPQLTTAAPIAAKISTGVDKLLGNENTTGLLGLQMSIEADRLRRGYFVVTDWPATEGHLKHLRIGNAGLEVMHSDNVQRPASGFNYVVLEVALTPSKPKRWRELDSITTLVDSAINKLGSAHSDKDIAAAGHAVLAAVGEALSNPDLTIEDRDVAAVGIEKMWTDAKERRKRVLMKTAEEAAEASAEQVLADVVALDGLASSVAKEMSMMRASAAQ